MPMGCTPYGLPVAGRQAGMLSHSNAAMCTGTDVSVLIAVTALNSAENSTYITPNPKPITAQHVYSRVYTDAVYQHHACCQPLARLGRYLPVDMLIRS